MAKDTFIEAFNQKGFMVIPDLIPLPFIERMREDMSNAIEQEVAYHGTRNYKEFGIITLAAIYGGTFLEVYSLNNFIRPFEWILGEECITYTITSSCIPPEQEIYTSRIHVDTPRVIPNYNTYCVGMLLLDDYTEESGATWFLPGSQNQIEKPEEAYFYANSERIIAKAGSVCYFNPRIWHAGAANQSKHWRRCLLLAMVRPWMKQRLDIPRCLAHLDVSSLPEKTLQKLGFLSQPPASYDEYYMPAEKRSFKQRVV